MTLVAVLNSGARSSQIFESVVCGILIDMVDGLAREKDATKRQVDHAMKPFINQDHRIRLSRTRNRGVSQLRRFSFPLLHTAHVAYRKRFSDRHPRLSREVILRLCRFVVARNPAFALPMARPLRGLAHRTRSTFEEFRSRAGGCKPLFFSIFRELHTSSRAKRSRSLAIYLLLVAICPPQIFEAVVASIAIDVIRRFSWQSRSIVCSKDAPMNCKVHARRSKPPVPKVVLLRLKGECPSVSLVPVLHVTSRAHAQRRVAYS